ncbi:serine/threonine-protein kinase [Rhodococcus sp. NPDC003348]
MFAGYRIERRLGSGGMGSVYLAAHPSLPRLVALKLPDPALTRDPEGRDRFLREADHTARLDHPNIVTVYDRGAERDPRGGAERDPRGGAERDPRGGAERDPRGGDEQLWISMQYVDGTDAATPLRRGPMPAARAVAIVADIARALDHAHTHGVLHRDVKPANILLTSPRPGDPERALLADFGIAKSLEATALTRTGTVVASLQYASPEQLEGRTLDGRSDQYALGCTLYHLLTGQLPFPGSDTAHLVHAHLNLPAPRVTAVRPDLPPALDAVIARAMAKNPTDRFPSSGALAAAANTALIGGAPATVAVPTPTTHLSTPVPPTTVAPTVTTVTPAGTAVAPTMTTVAPATATPTRPRRLLVPVAAGAAVAALAAAGATAWLLGDRGPDAASASSVTASSAPPAPVTTTAAPTHTETVLVPAPATTTKATTTTKKVPPGQAAKSSEAAGAPMDFVGHVDGADAQGFTDGSGPRCNRTNPAVVVARTDESTIVVCRTDAGRYYYMGRRDHDGSEIELDDPKATDDGFTVTNRSVKYALDPTALTITERGDVLAREPVLEYRYSAN